MQFPLLLTSSLLTLVASYEQFGTRTSYFKNSNDGTDLEGLEGCDIKKFWYLARHGARVPNVGLIEDWEVFLPELRDQIVDAFDAGNSLLSAEDIQALKEWELGVVTEEAEQLSASGWQEHEQTGDRWATRLANLSFTPDTVTVTASHKQRTIDSGLAFLTGLFIAARTEEGSVRERSLEARKKMAALPDIVVDDHLTRFYDFCDKHITEVDDNPETYAEEALLEESEYWSAMKANVADKSGVLLETTDLSKVWDICRYERAWFPFEGPEISPWCSLFGDNDLELYNYRSCLWRWWANGWGYDITQLETQPLLFNLVDSLLNYETSEANMVLNFGHSDTFQPFMTALGLFRDEDVLRASNWPDNLAGLQWDVSKIGSFSSNLGFVVAECPAQGGEPQVAMFHQERLVPQPKCGDKLLCPLADFGEGLASIAYADFDEVCAV